VDFMSGRIAGLLLGPAVFLFAIFTAPPEGLSAQGWAVAAVGLWMAIWWVSEAIPVPATALLPIILFPLLGIARTDAVAQTYMSGTIFLVLGGSLLALAIERTGMHQRLALAILARGGDHPRGLVLSFMIATALVSMGVSNTSTALIMLPIAGALLSAMGGLDRAKDDPSFRTFAIALALGIAYAANIGGLGTLVGSPTNAVAATIVNQSLGLNVNFLVWLAFGVPLVLIAIPASWFILTRVAFRLDLADIDKDALARAIGPVGALSTPEKRLLPVLLTVWIAWIVVPLVREPLGLPSLDDAQIAILGALALFLVPAGDGHTLLRWSDAKRAPWDTLILFGGGLALADAITKTGLAKYIGALLTVFGGLDPFVLAMVVAVVVIIATEFASNVAVASGFIPIVAGLAAGLSGDPLMLAMTAAMAATWGFMMPAGTPPNALAYATGYVRIPEMMRAGFIIDVLGIFLLAAIAYVASALL
jgi:sodium-dependent dicarboxylate transporter 2/3/5